MSIQTASADPLHLQPEAKRPAYATGMLLDAQDFSDEQTYHRGRLARALAFSAAGAVGGTLAGLAVTHRPAVAATATTPARPEEIEVAPGIAVDRLGRLIEIPRPACLRLKRWFDALAEDEPAELALATYTALANLVSLRLADAATPLPARALVADVYLQFTACPVGLTPAFAQGPFDALNAVSTSRLRDAYELRLVPRTGLDSAFNGLPLPPGPPEVTTGATATERRNAVQDAVLQGYGGTGRAGGQGGLAPLPGQPRGVDAAAVFIGRVFIAMRAAPSLQRLASLDVLVDNHGRRFLPSLALLAQMASL